MNDPVLCRTKNSGPRWFTRGSILVAIVLAIPWILIAVPPETISATRPIGNEFVGYPDKVSEYGWPFVHATGCVVDPFLRDKLARKTGPNPVLPSDVVLRKTYQNREPASGKIKSESQNMDGLRLACRSSYHGSFGPGDLFYRRPFWSRTTNWNYFSQGSVLRWNVAGLVMNIASLIAFALVMSTFVSLFQRFRRSRHKRWYQISLIEMGILAALVAVVSGVLVYEYRLGRQQSELIAKLQTEFELDFDENNYRDLLPVWCLRLADGHLDPEGSRCEGSPYSLMFRRIDLLRIKPIMWLDGAEKQQRLEGAMRAPELESLHVLDVQLSREGHEKFLEWLSTGIEQIRINVPADAGDRAADFDNLKRFTVLRSVELRGSVECPVDLPDSVEEITFATQKDEIDLAGLSHLKNLRMITIRRFGGRTMVQNAPEISSLKIVTLIGDVQLEPDAEKSWESKIRRKDF